MDKMKCANCPYQHIEVVSSGAYEVCDPPNGECPYKEGESSGNKPNSPSYSR